MSKPGPVMLDLKGTTIDAEEREMLHHPACGGVILFSRNIENARQIRDLNQQILKIRPTLLLAVDQEGGRVQRLKDGYSILPPLRHIESTANHDMTLASERSYHHARLMALETMASGFDISFTPCLDVCNSSSRVIGERAFHEEPAKIIELATRYLEGMHSVGMAATGKHFPGHGFVEGDSHVEMPVDKRSLSEIEQDDLAVFKALANQLEGIMPAHVIYSAIDAVPAGFSNVWIDSILRQQYQFNGVVFSDDLSMKGAEQAGDYNDRADAAIAAGCDMVLVCNTPNEAGNVLEHLRNYQSLVSSERILKMKTDGKCNIGLENIRTDRRWIESSKVVSTI
ncbi:beta-N-acetylhexosaminidase [Pleionea sediminis]|uniref:beta-N-acetylhexosaminidase n=1 Tax=Pleionea sediminis TaxID=2569479 RepID=UPI0013DE6F9D|nr:beta-N-acetylhexosaminidase [Pleionea sediminis]